jgi:hypothetical protein
MGCELLSCVHTNDGQHGARCMRFPVLLQAQGCTSIMHTFLSAYCCVAAPDTVAAEVAKKTSAAPACASCLSATCLTFLASCLHCLLTTHHGPYSMTYKLSMARVRLERLSNARPCRARPCFGRSSRCRADLLRRALGQACNSCQTALYIPVWQIGCPTSGRTGRSSSQCIRGTGVQRPSSLQDASALARDTVSLSPSLTSCLQLRESCCRSGTASVSMSLQGSSRSDARNAVSHRLREVQHPLRCTSRSYVDRWCANEACWSQRPCYGRVWPMLLTVCRHFQLKTSCTWVHPCRVRGVPIQGMHTCARS